MVRLVKEKDALAMRQLYLHHARYLTAVCSRYVSDADLADVVQDTFLKVFSSIGRFDYRGEGSLRGWMAKIAANESLKALQRRNELNALRLENGMPDVAAEYEDEPVRIAGVPMATVQAMIRSLPAGCRTVFNLYVFEGLGHKAIASLLDIGETTSASQYHRAKKMLAKMLAEYKDDNRHDKHE